MTNRTRLTKTDDILDAALEHGWDIDQTGTTLTLSAPPVLVGQFMEPQLLELQDIDGVISGEFGDNWVTTTIHPKHGEKKFKITGRAAYRAVANTLHPLRTSQFFKLVQTDDATLCEEKGMTPHALRGSKLRGYMPSKDADRFSIRLLGLHPAYVFGGKEWIRCYDEGWA